MLMDSSAQTQVDVPVPLAQASSALVPLLHDRGLSLHPGFEPGTSPLKFGSGTRAFRTALQGVALITPHDRGSTITLKLDVAPGHGAAILDGRRNRALLKGLATDLVSHLT